MSDTAVFLILAGALVACAAWVRYQWGVAAGELVAQGSPRFSRVLQRLGVDLGAVGSERTLREAAIGARKCVPCPDAEACDTWLAGSGRRWRAPRYCPNEPFLRILSRR
jgi:hypothetical protein